MEWNSRLEIVLGAVVSCVLVLLTAHITLSLYRQANASAERSLPTPFAPAPTSATEVSTRSVAPTITPSAVPTEKPTSAPTSVPTGEKTPTLTTRPAPTSTTERTPEPTAMPTGSTTTESPAARPAQPSPTRTAGPDSATNVKKTRVWRCSPCFSSLFHVAVRT